MSDTKQPVDYVDPLIDTAKPRIRWVFTVFTARPFGMVRLGPNTDVKGTWESGYRYNSDTIYGFSHIHAWQLAGISVMPITRPSSVLSGFSECGSRFRHDTESARPGYYSVMLEDYGVRAELTSTERVGFHRYTFPDASHSYILFDLGSELGPVEMSDAMVRKVSDTELEGYVENEVTRRRPKRCRIYFVARFSRPFESFGGWIGDGQVNYTDQVSGKDCGALVRYPTSDGEVVLLKVGLSYVSISQARRNLDAELPHWDFEQVCGESREVWNDWLSRIEVEGGTEDQRIKFYTDLWRTLVGGHLTSDVDGTYSDMTGPKQVVRQIPCDADGRPKYPHINGQDGFWHSQWSLSLLYALAYPEVTSHYCNFLVDMYKDGGLIPRGPSGGGYTFVMISAPTTPFLVAAYMKGIRTFDVEAAYEGMRRNAFPGGLMSKAGYEFDTCEGGGIEYYIQRGYIPEIGNVPGAMHVDGAAQTLEYAYQDGCLARMAEVLGKDDDYRLFTGRSRNYRNLFDLSTGSMRPRNVDGSWLEPFDPLSLVGWCEANAWQYTWHVPHDMQDLIGLMGGAERFTAKLNYAFEQAEAMDFYAPKPELRRDAAYVNYGNEPGRYVAHLFNHSGAPWLAQKWTRLVKERTFGSVEPMGFCEDDDQGKAAATSLLLAIGLFDVHGGAAPDPVYEITAPLFDRVAIHLDDRYYRGKQFVIEVRNNTSQNIYIQSATLNGKPLSRPWFYHREFAQGGLLALMLGPEPNKRWGARPEDAPPSMCFLDESVPRARSFS